jgi:hypothetical protein
MRKFGPKSDDAPSIGEPCPACHVPFKVGDYTTLVALGPGDNPEARQLMAQGRPYNAVAVEIHWDCSTKEG